MADEPDATTGTARAARGEQGRHRHGQPDDAALRSAADAPPRRSRRSRHARPADAAPGAAPHRGPDADPGRDAYGDWYRSDPYDPIPADPYLADAQPGAGAPYDAGPLGERCGADPYGQGYGADPYGGTSGRSPYDAAAYDPARYDPGSSRAVPHGAASHGTGSHGDASDGGRPDGADPHGGGPYSAEPYNAEPYNAEPYSAEPYSGATNGGGTYGALHGRGPHRDPYGVGPHSADPYGADPYGADPYGAPDGGNGAGPPDADPYGTGSPRRYPNDPPSDARYGDHSDSDEPHSASPRHDGPRHDGPARRGPRRRAAASDAHPPEPPQRSGRADDGTRLGDSPRGGADTGADAGADRARGGAVRGDADAPRTAHPDAAGSAAGGRDLHPRPGPPPDPGVPGRRPGDPPGVPAELFVETTAETPALRLDDLPPEPDDRTAAADAEPAHRPEGPAGRGRSLLLRLRPGRDDAPATGHSHGHGHGHGPARPAGRRVRIVIAALLVPCALATLVGLVLLWPTGGPPPTAGPITQEQVRAEVTATRVTDCTPESGDGGCVALVVHMADGPLPGRDLVQVVPVEPGSPQFAIGDQVVLGWSGADPEDAGSYQIVDFQRGAPLAWLAGLFAVAVLLLGRWRGLAALAALALSFVVLLAFVVPAILAGSDPLAVAVVGSCLIMFAVLYLTHGPSARTSTAVLGTLLSLALIGGLGAAFSAAAQLTGLDDQTSNLIASLGTGVDARGLLLAGVVIGALGVLDDVTVTQTSAVWELRHANPQLGARALFTAAMRIGRDHVASAVNTLVLAYAGAALPLMLLFSLSGRGLGEVVTAQDVATEVVRTLVGSIGLVASVPITTAIAAAVAVRETAPAAEAPA
ncbi:YibE/F family protein [Pseudonocardia sichuanensis]